MKRTLKTLMILVMAMLLMTGCGNDKSEESNVTSDANTDINADANEVGGTFNTGKDYPIDIKDIDWRVESGIIDGQNTVAFSYTNNSSYTICDVEMKFTQKSDVTDDQRSVFDTLAAERDWTDDDVKAIYILGYNRHFADPGETAKSTACVINGTYTLVENIQQYELMEPDSVEVAYIGDNDKMYMMTYDFKNNQQSYTLDEGKDIFEWSDSDISKLIPKTKFRVVNVDVDNTDAFAFSGYGVTHDEYIKYVDDCKKNGFTDIEADSTSNADNSYYKAYNTNGYFVTAGYSSESDKISVFVSNDTETTTDSEE